MSEMVEKYASVVKALDKVADSVQSKGLIKEAEEIDIITNTIEKIAKKIPAGKDRPAPIFSDSSSKVKDKKDHFPIPDIAHARNALQRVNQYSEVPSWYNGSLSELKSAVVRAVKSRYPSIQVDVSKYKS